MIKINELTKYYSKTRGIEDLYLKVVQGEIFGLLGPNGAGKTTTIRMLMGMLKPSRGSSEIGSYDCWKQSFQVKKICGYIPGDVHLYHEETGNSLIDIFGDIRKNKSLSSNLIERFEFNPSIKIKHLSKGNRQKLAVILAFMHKPDVLILDEPTSGLDPIMQQEFYKLVKEFQKRGATILISSHFLPEIQKLCQKVGIVKDGFLVGVENVEELGIKHLSHLNVTFENKPDLSKYKISQILEIKHTLNNHYQMKVKGDIDPVIKALSKDIIKDLSFEHATLEEVFMEYYS